MGVTTMAPALTEAATQAIKLPESTPASSDSAGRQADDQSSKEQQTGNIRSDNPAKCKKSNSTADVSPVSHLNGNSLRAVDKQSSQPSAFPKLQGAVGAIIVPGQVKNFVIGKGVLLQNLVSKKISATSLLCGKVSQSGTMNQSTGLDKEDRLQLGHGAQNKTHTREELGGSSSARAAKPPQTGSHLYVQRPGGNLGAAARGSKPVSQTATRASNHFLPGGGTYRHMKNADVSKASASSSVESSLEGHEVDMTVSAQLDEASKKQAQLERRLEFLIRRHRRAQARQVDRHIKQELLSYVEYHQQNLQTVSKSASKSSLGCQNGDDLNKELLSDGAKHMSTAALVSLVHKMQKQGSTSQLPLLIKPEVTTMLNMSDVDRQDSLMVMEKLGMNLHMMQLALDSDATESSSGGETDSEDGPQDTSHPPSSTPLSRRAEWKWASQRAAIASRWTWLQAQVSDLEYRIRQQTELYRQARNSKGPVVLAEPSLPSTQKNKTSACTHDGRTSVILQGSRQSPSAADEQSGHVNPSATKCSSTVTSSSLSSCSSSQPISGVHSHEPPHNRQTNHSTSSGPPSSDLDPAADPSCRSARCLPLKYILRKRKLLRTTELDLKSAKAAKPSTVKCHCHQAMTPCVLCCGKEKAIQPIDPHNMSFQERVALMDPSFHPVLSFREEVPLSVHFEGLLRSGECQNKATVRRPRAEQGQRSQKVSKLPNLSEGRKALLRKSQSSVIIQSAKIRNKYEHKTARKLGPPPGLTLGNRTLSADLKGLNHAPFGVGRGRGRRKRGQGARGGYMRRGLELPPLSHDGAAPKEKEVRRRRGESAYDINSIVIPRSMAALTRVEKLEYKEIPTPSWRELMKESEKEEDSPKARVPVPKSNGLIAEEMPDETEETEDLSDDVYMQRHSICEMAEKKRFTSAVRVPHGRRRARAVMRRPTPDPTPLHVSSQPSTPNTPVATGTQFSVDAEEAEVKETDSRFVEQLGLSRLQPAAPVTPMPPSGNEGQAERESWESARWGSLPLSHERESVQSGVDSLDPSDSSPTVKTWPLRQFPLSDEEVCQLEKEDLIVHNEKANPNLRAMPHIQNLRPQPVETGSQAGSSVSSSLPPSPLPSTSSASLGEDWDTGDADWTLEADGLKKKVGQTKMTKR